MIKHQSQVKYRCPVCKDPLIFVGDAEGEGSLVCTREACVHCAKSFPIYKSIPFLLPIGQPLCISSEFMLAASNEPTGGYSARVTSRSIIKLRRYCQSLFYGLERAERSNYSIVCDRSPANPSVLVIGGGNTNTAKSSSLEWVQTLLDKGAKFEVTDIYYSPFVDCISDAHYLPYSSQCFDLVIITTVLEHVVDPQMVVSEVYRVLRNGGIVYATVPFVQCVHEGAYDFTRYTLAGQRWLFREYVEIASGSFAGAFQSTLYNLSATIQSFLRIPGLAVLIRILLWRFCQLLDRMQPLGVSQDVSMCNYFIGLKDVSVPPLLARDLVGYYHAKRSS